MAKKLIKENDSHISNSDYYLTLPILRLTCSEN